MTRAGDLSTDDPFPTEPSYLLSVVTITRYLIMYSAAIRLRYSRRKRPAASPAPYVGLVVASTCMAIDERATPFTAASRQEQQHVRY